MQTGDRVYFKGFLVDVYNTQTRETLKTSRMLRDTGIDSCEVVYVTEIYRY